MSKHKPDGRPTHQYERARNTYDRLPGGVLPGRSILIVCEGAETEPNYFLALRNYLKLLSVQVTIESRGGAPISIVQRAEQLVRKRNKDLRNQKTTAAKFEEVWCVFDVENLNDNPSFFEAVRKADEQKFSLAVSNPAFEFWYILHFEHTTRPFSNGNEAKDYLRRLHIPTYNESRPVFSDLIDQTTMAIRRSKSILEKHPQGSERFPNPSTYVHLLVTELFTMSPSMRERTRTYHE